MLNMHPFVVKIQYDNRVEHLFCDNREDADKSLKALTHALRICDKALMIGDSMVISLEGFQSAKIIEKPVDMTDSKWMG